MIQSPFQIMQFHPTICPSVKLSGSISRYDRLGAMVLYTGPLILSICTSEVMKYGIGEKINTIPATLFVACLVTGKIGTLPS
jgi:hypothetical protein